MVIIIIIVSNGYILTTRRAGLSQMREGAISTVRVMWGPRT